MNAKTTAQSLLEQITSITRMEKGSLSILRQTSKGPACNFQRWENGRNRSEYIPPAQVTAVEENLQEHARFEALVEQYVETVSSVTREERLAGAKKKRPAPASPLPKKPKSKT